MSLELSTRSVRFGSPSTLSSGRVVSVDGVDQAPHVSLRWVAAPSVLDDLTETLFVAAFEGWNDAGEAATSAAQRLIERWQAQPLLSIDLEEFVDFSSTRPTVEFHDGTRRIVWPTTALYLGRLDDGRPVIIANGPEPQLRWRMYTQVMLSVLQRANVTLGVLLGALLADVPHTRATRVTRTVANNELAELHDATVSRYEGPTGMVGVLADALGSTGIDAVSVWAAVPGSHSPRAALAMLDHLGSMLAEVVSPIDLHVEAAAFDRQISEVIDGDEDMRRYVHQLEEQFDAGEDDESDGEQDWDEMALQLSPDDVVINGSLTDAAGKPLTGDDLAEELEQFLRERDS
jgi:hypothetical protein